MNIPNIPTDNIYKFFAIFGLVIFLSSIYLEQSSDKNIHDAKIQIELSQTKRSVDSMYLENTIKMFDMRLGMAKEREILPRNNLSIEYLLQEKTEIEKAYQEIQKGADVYRNSNNESFKNETGLVYYKYEQEKYRFFAKTLMVFGILLIACGFTSWYFKHQIYIDAEIKWKGETFRKLLKDADNISNSNTKQTEEANADIPHDES